MTIDAEDLVTQVVAGLVILAVVYCVPKLFGLFLRLSTTAKYAIAFVAFWIIQLYVLPHFDTPDRLLAYVSRTSAIFVLMGIILLRLPKQP